MRLLLISLFVLCSQTVYGQTTSYIPAPSLFTSEIQTDPSFRLGTTLRLEWDFSAADIKNAEVNRFEVQVDSGPWVNTSSAIPSPGDTYSYTIPSLVLPVGKHIVSVRACNVHECGSAASAGVTIFEVIIPVTPSQPRIVPVDQIVSIPEALEVVQAYATLALGRRLVQSELDGLAARYPYRLVFGDVLRFMDEEYIRLVNP
jgi:hypothetical protein